MVAKESCPIFNMNAPLNDPRWMKITRLHTKLHWKLLSFIHSIRRNLVNTATHCNTLQHTARHCNTLQHTATHCRTLVESSITQNLYSTLLLTDECHQARRRSEGKTLRLPECFGPYHGSPLFGRFLWHSNNIRNPGGRHDLFPRLLCRRLHFMSHGHIFYPPMLPPLPRFISAFHKVSLRL